MYLHYYLLSKAILKSKKGGDRVFSIVCLKKHFLVLVLSCLLLIFLPGCATEQEEVTEETVELILGSPFPGGHFIQELMIDPLAEELAEQSNGRIQLTSHPGGAISAGPAVYEDVVGGAMDIGWVMHGYTPGRFPLTQVIEMPFQWTSAEETSKILWQLFEQNASLQEEYEDVKMITMWVHDPGSIYSNEPIRTMEDLSGKRTRFPGPLQEAVLEELGAVPVGMPAPEIYDSVERGVIDCVGIAHSAATSYRLDEICDYVTMANLYVGPFALVMNKDSWAKLSPEDQQLLDSLTGERLAIKGGQLYDEENKKATELMQDVGAEVIELPDAELERWNETVAVVVERWIDDREAQGLPAQELYDQMMEIAGN